MSRRLGPDTIQLLSLAYCQFCYSADSFNENFTLTMEIDSSGLRKRKGGIQKIVEDLDIFEKVVDNVKEEKKVSSGLSKFFPIVFVDYLVSFICFAFISVLVFGEVYEHLFGRRQYDYRFDVDTDLYGYDFCVLLNKHITFRTPMLSIDMVVATPCNSLTASSSLDQTGGIFAPLQESIKKDPTRFILQFYFFYSLVF